MKRKLIAGIAVLGILLLLAAAALTVWQKYEIKQEEQYAAAALQALLSERSTGLLVEQSGTMPRAQIAGRDYIGLLELPERGIALAVAADATTDGRPACTDGSLYDGTLVLRGDDSFAFTALLDENEPVLFTDVTGQCFDFTVRSILRSAEPAPQSAPLTLVYPKDGKYLIVSCDTQ